jgi:tRNA threonylcarbamoyladenosine biosynthesis protein TsaB
MRILSVDTSNPLASVAITIEEKVLAETVFNTDRTLSARLIPEIDRLLTIAGLTISDIDLFACSAGPGSFTGVRAGVATVQGLALATGKPCVGFSTLALLASNLPLAAHPVCCLLDARKSEVYGALFNCSGTTPKTIINDCVLPPEAFMEIIIKTVNQSVIFCGDGAVRYKEVISEKMGAKVIFAPFTHNAVHAANGAVLAMEKYKVGKVIKPAQLLPVYLRASEAEYAKMNRQAELKGK